MASVQTFLSWLLSNCGGGSCSWPCSCFLIPVWITLSCSQDHRNARNKQLCADYFTHFMVGQIETRFALWMHVSDDSHSKFISHSQYSREITLLRWVCKHSFMVNFGSDLYGQISFRHVMITHLCILIQLFSLIPFSLPVAFMLDCYGWNLVCCFDVLVRWSSYQLYFAWLVPRGDILL